ncbi:hypothetical protein CKQ90_32685, partial [Klebsiella pneumoniae]
EPVTVRFRASGHLHIVGRHGGRKLKKLWQELGVAPWRRDTTPLLFYGETPIAAADEPVTVRFRASGHLHIVGRHGGRKLKKLWQELGV